jgi:hypothetical protein
MSCLGSGLRGEGAGPSLRFRSFAATVPGCRRAQRTGAPAEQAIHLAVLSGLIINRWLSAGVDLGPRREAGGAALGVR